MLIVVINICNYIYISYCLSLKDILLEIS